MKYIVSALLILAFVFQSYTQNINFNIANPQPAIHEVYSGSIVSGDLDDDGDIDLVQSGIGLNLMGTIAKATVFLNDGDGNFTKKQQNFNNFFSTEQIVMGDLDNDEDLDLIIAANNRTDFYRNDGQAQFIYDGAAPFLPSSSGELIIGDVDGDDDNDVLQFGKLNSAAPFAILFLNDGSGTFTSSQDTDFIPLDLSRIEFIDLEGDGDKDLLSFGININNEAEINVYENDGSGNYSVFLNSNIAPIAAEEISVGDIDNDGDQDVLVSGFSSGFGPKTALYINDGIGQFSERINTSFPDVFSSSNAFADLDNDNDLDVVIIGSMNGGIPNIFSIVFENTGNNNFIASDSLGGEYIPASTIADLNGDGKKDIIIQGFVDDTNIYWNESVISTVKEIADIPFSVFPNPANGRFQIEWKEEVFNRIEILDQHGKTILNEAIHEQGLHYLEINAPSGWYILKMYGEERVSSQKILLVK